MMLLATCGTYKTSWLFSLLFSLVLICTATSVRAAGAKPANWHGFRKQSFTVNGDAAFVVEPAIAAPGKPWVWRTSFPDYHSEVDQELLRCGFHVAYLEVLNMLGSDAALDRMDAFYYHVRKQWGLAEKPALEGVSRGGLHAYRYAARHPDRIACIYADTPVMDFKSWPRKCSKPDWALIMKHYGFANEQAATDYKGNPVDQLEAIAKAKIPLRHVISLNDTVVPPEENTLEAKRHLQKLGSDIEIVTVKAGTKESNGHHFPLPEVFQSARFIMDHAYVLPNGKEYFRLRSGLGNCKTKFEKDKTGRVVFLGGSITFNPGWRDEVMRYLKQRFPGTKFDFVAAGIPSVGSNGHAFRLERDVLHRGPVDLIFIEAAVNDGGNIPDKPEVMLRSMEGVVRHLRTVNPMTDIVQMHFVSPADIPLFQSGKVPQSIAQHEKVAEAYGCTSLNLSLEVADRIKAGQFTWKSGFNNVHPPPYGQQVYFDSMTRMLDAAFATAEKPAAHKLPKQCLDSRSYATGRYGDIATARIIKGFKLVPKWNPRDGKGTREGFVNVPALVGNAPGDEFEFEFTGTACGLFLASGPRSATLECSVDGGAYKPMETLTQWSGGLHLPWPLILADGLPTGKHTVKVRIAAGRHNRTSLCVIHLLLN